MNNKSLTVQLQKLFWMIPFICFLLGYYSLHLFYKPKTLVMPHLIDKSALEALTLLGPDKINIRLINQKEDTHKPEGIIVEQMPTAGQMIKPYQTVFLVTSKQTRATQTPDCLSKPYHQMIEWLKDNNITYQLFFFNSTQPPLSCLAQIPQPNQNLNQQGMILYYAAKTNKNPVIMPNFIGLSLETIQQFLAPYQIEPTVFHQTCMPTDHHCSQCIVKEQRPLPGALISVKENLLIQLKMV
ncbi:MAG: PASTA domain-containing protein [Proteobacteria bacterium]|nr:PASTA domain-containing protein [Pseudomonadota bacterium]NBP13870.1 PASTA domain-containing protein [bacterium]